MNGRRWIVVLVVLGTLVFGGAVLRQTRSSEQHGGSKVPKHQATYWTKYCIVTSTNSC